MWTDMPEPARANLDAGATFPIYEDPLDPDAPGDAVVATTRRALLRLVLVATEAAARFARRRGGVSLAAPAALLSLAEQIEGAARGLTLSAPLREKIFFSASPRKPNTHRGFVRTGKRRAGGAPHAAFCAPQTAKELDPGLRRGTEG